MSATIKTLGSVLVVDTKIRSVLIDQRWKAIPLAEWKFLLRISRKKVSRARATAYDRKVASRLRRRIGSLHVELVRGHGYRLGTP